MIFLRYIYIYIYVYFFSFIETSTDTVYSTTDKDVTTTLTTSLPADTTSVTAPTTSLPVKLAVTSETEPNPGSNTDGLIFVAIGIVVGLLLCICGILVVVLIYYRNKKKTKRKLAKFTMDNVAKTTYEEEETYDELDDKKMDEKSTNKSSDNTGPATEPLHSGIPNEYLDINGLPRKSLQDDYLSTKCAEVIKGVENSGRNIDNIYLHMTDSENLLNADKGKGRKDGYLTPLEVTNLYVGTVPSCENGKWENNPASETQGSKGTKDGVKGEGMERQNDYLGTIDLPEVPVRDEVKNCMEYDRMKTDNDNVEQLDDKKLEDSDDGKDKNDGYLSPIDLAKANYDNVSSFENNFAVKRLCTEEINDELTDGEKMSDPPMNDLATKQGDGLDIQEQGNRIVQHDIDNNPYMSQKQQNPAIICMKD